MLLLCFILHSILKDPYKTSNSQPSEQRQLLSHCLLVLGALCTSFGNSSIPANHCLRDFQSSECYSDTVTVGRIRSFHFVFFRSWLIIGDYHVTESQNTRDQITSDSRSKRAWSKCVLCIPFILSGSPKECWLHTCDACVTVTKRFGLRAPLVAHNNVQHQGKLQSWWLK